MGDSASVCKVESNQGRQELEPAAARVHVHYTCKHICDHTRLEKEATGLTFLPPLGVALQMHLLATGQEGRPQCPLWHLLWAEKP